MRRAHALCGRGVQRFSPLQFKDGSHPVVFCSKGGLLRLFSLPVCLCSHKRACTTPRGQPPASMSPASARPRARATCSRARRATETRARPSAKMAQESHSAAGTRRRSRSAPIGPAAPRGARTVRAAPLPTRLRRSSRRRSAGTDAAATARRRACAACAARSARPSPETCSGSGGTGGGTHAVRRRAHSTRHSTGARSA